MARPVGGYKLANGHPVPGVTTILKRFQESGGLLQWAFQQGKEGKDFLYEERDKAADIGTVAHALVEQHIANLTFRETLQDFSTIPPAVMAPARAAFNAFKIWERQTKLEILHSEVSMTCDCHCFGGTLDAIGDIDDKLCLLDFKSANALYHDALYQMAAYRHLWAINHPLARLEGGFHLLRFSKTSGDFAHHFFPELEDAWQGFLLMRQLFDIDKSLKRRAG